MILSPSPPAIEAAAEILLKRYGAHTAALMAYGSRVVGQPRMGSEYDFWMIIRDAEAFHRENAEFYRTQLTVKSAPEEQILLNRAGPIFYSIKEGGIRIKFAVLDDAAFAKLCRDKWWTVKGRMQKPMRVIRSTPLVDEAILVARREGLACGLSLVPREFSLEELVEQIVSLSYRAEVRPERKGSKIRSILRSGGAAIADIYRPLLEELPYVKRQGDKWLDTRTDEQRRWARKSTLRALRRSKWSRQSLFFIWRNYRSHGSPIKYIFKKLLGELEKIAKKPFRAKHQ